MKYAHIRSVSCTCITNSSNRLSTKEI